VPSLDQQIGAGHHPPVRGTQHGRVVADPDQLRRAGRQNCRDLLDQAELACLGNGNEILPRVRRDPGALARGARPYLR
jgi:hypothetical protein